MTSEINPGRILIKALCLFVAVNILYGLLAPKGGEISGYNVLFPGRTRFPFGVLGDPYTVTVDDLDVMFASHLIAAPKTQEEYRIVLIGDSSVWGEGVGAYDVISEQWNTLSVMCAQKTMRVYNLGYPHPSVVKDLVILDKAMEHQPDLIIWFVTLNTLISQRVNPFLAANQERTVQVLNSYDISFRQGRRLAENRTTFWDKTLVGQRSNLARRIKLQLLGIIWTATGADTNTLAQDGPRDLDIGDNTRYRGMGPSDDLKPLLLFSALSAGHDLAEQTPVLIINEPMFVAPRSDKMMRYNAAYPRWAYDQYREAMTAQAERAGWMYLDLWNTIPPRYFLDASLHLGAEGGRLLIEQVLPAIQPICNSKL